MELRHLRYFVAVAEDLSFSRAAERLLVAQPALSTQIAQLEAELGVVLLDRNRRSVRLTLAGEGFLQDARGLLRAADEASERARRVARGEQGQLTVAFFSAPTMIFLPEIVKHYRSLFPGISLRLLELTPERQLPALLHGEADLGFTRVLPPGYPQITTQLLFEERLLVVLPESHRWAGRSSLELAELAAEDFVLLERSEASMFFDHIVSACLTAGFSPRVLHSPNLMATVVTLVAAEQGISLVPEGVQNLRRQGLRYVPLSPAPAPVPLLMSWPAQAESPACASFRQLVAERLDWIKRSFVGT
ncbi:LysR family transcriptional regulator [bacterium]|nr:LysR family transcriptional regulator [bacterium]